MARDNQGLQIALIIFVMLAVVLGATTWFFYSKATDMEAKAKASADEQQKAQEAANAANNEATELKKLISGAAAPAKLDEMQKQAVSDMQAFGSGLAPEEQFYRPLVVKLAKTLQEKNAEIKAKNVAIATWEAKYKAREASKDPQIKNFREVSEKAGQDLAAEQQKYSTRRAELEKQEADAQAKLASARKDATAQQAKLDDAIQKLKKDLSTTQGSLEQKTTTINSLKRTIVDHPDGEIRWVNQQNGMVWINVGRADGLQPLMSFSVYPADVSDLSKGARKGSIEVTQILGDHLAEARITDDAITDPFMPGDKIDTSLWNPGEQLHFALAGLMDVNDDNRNDLELVKNLITMNNGVVDCYEDDKGRVHGLDQMSINTRFLVSGSEGKNDASVAAVAAGITKIKNEADKLGVQKILLKDLLQRMGYKAPVSTKATGEETSQYHPKGGSTPPRTKASDLFQPRQPAARSGGAY
jgi:chemotaxis protein histidine kinase CheA